MADVVSYGVTYRGVNCVALSGGTIRIALRLTRGLYSGLAVRGTDTTIPALAGRVARNRVKDLRHLEIEGFVAGVGATELLRLVNFDAAMQAMDAIFDPSLAAGTLVVDLPAGGTATISARTLDETIEGSDAIPGFRTMSYRLEAVSPNWSISGS